MRHEKGVKSCQGSGETSAADGIIILASRTVCAMSPFLRLPWLSRLSSTVACYSSTYGDIVGSVCLFNITWRLKPRIVYFFGKSIQLQLTYIIFERRGKETFYV